MAEPVNSSMWTGPLSEESPPSRYGVFTHSVGSPSGTPDYAHLAKASGQAGLIPAELWSVIRLAAWLLVTPVTLWLGWIILRSATRDWIIEDNVRALLVWGLSMIALAVWQIGSRSISLIWFRKAILRVALLATPLLSVGYVYLGMQAHARATVSTAERAFESVTTHGRGPFTYVVLSHQRADGTMMGGAAAAQTLDYGRTCALVQHLDADLGFRWVRILGRSRAPGRGQLSWPIRREECFSAIPLSTLPR